VFVGHGLLAFALVALAGERLGWDRPAVVRVAVLAGLFATLPDVDVVYGLAGLLGGVDAAGVAESFWAAGNRVHRGVTHSLVVGLVTAAAVWPLARRPGDRSPQAWLPPVAGLALLGGGVAGVALLSGPLAGAIAGLFAAGAVGLVWLAGRAGLSARATAGSALVGLCTHPFGDLFTGSPPTFLYPLDATLVGERVTLAADPTLHLLGAFGVELAVVWLALFVAFRLTDRRLTRAVDRRAGLGALYGVAALALPAPTLEVSYHFVFSVLAVGSVGVVPPTSLRARLPRAAATAVATVTVAAVAYACVYALA